MEQEIEILFGSWVILTLLFLKKDYFHSFKEEFLGISLRILGSDN